MAIIEEAEILQANIHHITMILSKNLPSCLYSISIEYKMENTKIVASSLQQKLDLLKALRSGRL